MDRPPVGFNQWSLKNYQIAANVQILQNVMLIFRMVPTNTGKKPILANWILKRTKIILKKIILKKTNSLFNLRTSPGTKLNTLPLAGMRTRPGLHHWYDASIFIGFFKEADT